MPFENYDQLIYTKGNLEQATDVPSIVGEIELEKFRIISPNNYPGVSIDLRYMMSKFEIVENVFSPYVSGYIEITDSIGLYEKIPITNNVRITKIPQLVYIKEDNDIA